MRYTRFLTAVLAAVLLVCLPILPTQAATPAQGDFVGDRTVVFTFDVSDLDNYANGGRAGVDLYLRKSAPDWLGYTLRGSGRSVALTFQFDFVSFTDYTEKVATLLAAQPDILYSHDENLILVEDFGAAQLLGCLQVALGESKFLSQRAKVTADTLTIDGETYDVTDGVKILPDETAPFSVKRLIIDTKPKKKGFERIITLTVDAETADGADWRDFVRRCKKVGKVKDEEEGDEVVLEITFAAANLPALSNLTATCLSLPVCQSANLTEAKADGCTYLFAETFFLDGFLTEYSTFSYTFTCPDSMQNVTAASEGAEVLSYEEPTEEDEAPTMIHTVESDNRSAVKFSYTAPFRFEQMKLHTEWPSALAKKQRRITLTAPITAAEIYHEVIKEELADASPRGTVLEMYDQDATRYYVLTFSAWDWDDIADFTEAFIKTELDCADSLLPYGGSSLTEELSVGGVVDGFDPVYSVQASYRMPGTMENAKDGTLTFADPTEAMVVAYRHLHLIKLAVWVIVVAAVAITVVILLRKRKKSAQDMPPASPAAEKEPVAVE